MIRDYQAIMKTWFPIGKQRIIPTYGKNEGVKLVGILDYETGHVYVEEHKKYDAQVFLQFLKNVLEIYPTGKIVMILDILKVKKIYHIKVSLKPLQRLAVSKGRAFGRRSQPTKHL